MYKNEILYKNIDDILEKAKELKNKTFADLKFSLPTHKGSIGDYIEDWFGIKKNNLSEPDFKKIGVDLELKTTPIKLIRGNKYSAKERLVLGKINFEDIVKEENFATSNIFNKVKNMLIINYIQDFDNFMFSKFLNAWLLNFTESEFQILENDFKIIVDKVKKGEAHNLSAEDTTFLEAVTKGKGHGELVKQPFSEINASPRAFALKTGFMTRRTRQIYGEVVPIARTREQLLNFVKNKFNEYIGLTSNEILIKLGKKCQFGKSSHSNAMKYLLKSLNLSNEDFEQLSIVFKTQKKGKNNLIQESMSFSQIDFSTIKYLDFVDTDVYEALSNGIFLNIFSNKMKYEGSKLIKFTKFEIETAEILFNSFREKLGTLEEFMPKLSQNKVIHIRNKDKNSKIKKHKIDGVDYPHLAWWINRNHFL